MTVLMLVLSACTGTAGAQEAGEEDGGGFFGFGGDGEEGEAPEGEEGEGEEGEEGAPEGEEGEEGAPEGEEGEEAAPPEEDGEAPPEGEEGEEGAPEEEGEAPPEGEEGVEPPVDEGEIPPDEQPPADEGEDPERENPDPEADDEEVVDETQDPAQDPCEPQGLPEHNGQQTSVRGSAVCNRGAFGVLPADGDEPQVRILNPENGERLRVGQDFDVTIAFTSFEAGLFDDPQTQYGVRPFSINGDGDVIGHAHIYVQQLERNNVPSPVLDSFLALNDPSEDGQTLSGTVPGVAEPGLYRICTDIAGGNHITAPKGNAQRGVATDCIQVLIGRRR